MNFKAEFLELEIVVADGSFELPIRLNGSENSFLMVADEEDHPGFVGFDLSDRVCEELHSTEAGFDVVAITAAFVGLLAGVVRAERGHIPPITHYNDHIRSAPGYVFPGPFQVVKGDIGPALGIGNYDMASGGFGL